jgi:hypothetical protein
MKKYRDEIAMVCHEIVEDGYSLGVIDDAEMREFEENAFVSDSKPAQKAPEAPQTGLHTPATA